MTTFEVARFHWLGNHRYLPDPTPCDAANYETHGLSNSMAKLDGKYLLIGKILGASQRGARLTISL